MDSIPVFSGKTERELTNWLNSFSYSSVLNAEANDPQFHSIQSAFKNSTLPPTIITILCITEALLCYQLSGTGEEHWKEFSLFIYKLQTSATNDFANNFEHTLSRIIIQFLSEGKTNRRLIEQKIKRVNKFAQNGVREMLKTIELHDFSYQSFMNIVPKVMKQHEDDKTILFAFKILRYCARIAWNIDTKPNPHTLLPIDSRMKALSSFLGIPEGETETFYRRVALHTDIPLLCLDAVIWPSLGLAFEKI